MHPSTPDCMNNPKEQMKLQYRLCQAQNFAHLSACWKIHIGQAEKFSTLTFSCFFPLQYTQTLGETKNKTWVQYKLGTYRAKTFKRL